MRKRNVHIQFWLDKKEAEAFQKKVKKSGLSREAYLRHLVNGLEPQDAPPPDYYAMMRELHPQPCHPQLEKGQAHPHLYRRISCRF